MEDLKYVDFDEELAKKSLEVLAKKITPDEKIQEFQALIQSRIAERGLELNGEPTLAAVLEERLKMTDLSTEDKLAQSAEIIAIVNFFKDFFSGIYSPMPETLKKAAELQPGIYDILAPNRVNLN